MKTIHRIAALVLALILSLSIALPALADARNETQAFSSSVVLVSYKGADGSRKATGVAIGDLTNPADVIVLVHPWVISSQEQAQVTLTSNGNEVQKDCLCITIDEHTAIVFPQKPMGGVSPLVMQSSVNVPASAAVMQLYNTGAKAVFAHDGIFVEVGEVSGHVTGRAMFAADDLNRLQTDPWKSLGSAIVARGSDGVNYLLGTVQSVAPSTESIYFRDSVDLLMTLRAVGYEKNITVASDFPSVQVSQTAPSTGTSDSTGAATVNVTKVLENYNREMSSKQLTQTIILIVAGVVILAAVVAIVLLLLRRKKGAPAGGGKAAYKLVGLTGPLSGQEFALTSTLTMGRSSACNIVFSNNAAGVSGRHCEVSVKNGVVYLKDLGSSYGTLDNNSKKIPANEPVVLRKGEAFFLGSRENGFMLR